MNDPFFAAVDDVQPVFASKTLDSKEAPNLTITNTRQYHPEDDFPPRYQPQRQREPMFEQPSRSTPHRPQQQQPRKKREYYCDGHKVRLPSMLNDIKSPKPLKINPKKPPASQILYFDSTVPTGFYPSQPYDD